MQQNRCNDHNGNSHDDDQSKYLKHEQIVAVADVDIFGAFIIGRESRDLNAARDIVHINITSLWFLCNSIRQIGTGWVFQLNADATFSFYRAAVDMAGFGVNSVGNHNHSLC